MSKKKPAKKPARSGVPLSLWIDAELAAALESYLAATEPTVTKTATMEAALREFLRKMGHWPPKKKPV